MLFGFGLGDVEVQQERRFASSPLRRRRLAGSHAAPARRRSPSQSLVPAEGVHSLYVREEVPRDSSGASVARQELFRSRRLNSANTVTGLCGSLCRTAPDHIRSTPAGIYSLAWEPAFGTRSESIQQQRSIRQSVDRAERPHAQLTPEPVVRRRSVMVVAGRGAWE
eukprot:scaffold764_cov248-Pinguiococcus_pyrenoidosus.AAC.31